LKPDYPEAGCKITTGLSALDPGKQGLKHLGLNPFAVGLPALSALDPGKQGLKQNLYPVVKAFECPFSA